MLNPRCYVCDDKRHFSIKKGDAENLLRYINRFLSKYSMEEVRSIKKEYPRDRLMLKRGIRNFSSMCGHCSKIDTRSLKMVEEKIVESVVNLKILAEKNDDKSTLHQVYRQLCGRYPHMANYYKKSIR